MCLEILQTAALMVSTHEQKAENEKHITAAFYGIN